MKRIRWWIGVPMFAAAALIGGCLAMSNRSLPEPIETAFHETEGAKYHVTLYSLEPGVLGAPDTSDGKTFHEHKILGETRIDDAATRKKVFTAFRRGVADHDGSIAACFI